MLEDTTAMVSTPLMPFPNVLPRAASVGMICVTGWEKPGCGQGRRGEFPLCHNLCSQELWPLLTLDETLASHCAASRRSKPNAYLLWEQTVSKNLPTIPLQDDMWENDNRTLPEIYNHLWPQKWPFPPSGLSLHYINRQQTATHSPRQWYFSLLLPHSPRENQEIYSFAVNSFYQNREDYSSKLCFLGGKLCSQSETVLSIFNTGSLQEL